MFSGEKLRLENTQGQAGSDRKGPVQRSEHSRLIIKCPVTKSYPSLATHFYLQTPIFSTTPMFVVFPHKNNINLNNTTLLQTALQQALLGGTLWSQENVAEDKYPVPNFIICGTQTSLHSHVNDDDRICSVPNHSKFVLEAAKDLKQCIAQLMVVQVLLLWRVSSVGVGTIFDFSSTPSEILLSPQKSGLFHSTISPHHWIKVAL